MSTEARDQGREEFGLVWALVACAFCAYLFYGAYCSFVGARWPGFMPPQLDVVAFVFSFISETAGAYVAGAMAALLGVAFLVGGVIALLRKPRKAAPADASSN